MHSEQQIIDDLKDWKQIIKPYTKSDNKMAMKQVYNTFIPFILIFTLACFAYEYNIWLGMFIALLDGFFLTRVFIIQHDCGHQAFFEKKKQNNRMGFICSFLTLIPYSYWARSHNHHHSHQGQLDTRTIGDVTLLTVSEFNELSSFEKFKYKVYRSVPVMFLIGPLYYIFIHNRLPLISLKGWKKEKRALVLTNLYLVIFYAILGALIGYQKLLLLYLPIIVSFAVNAIWFFYIQHQHDPNYKAWKKDWEFLLAAIVGSSYYKLPKILNFFSGNIGYHHLHHLSPKIPFYYLEKCSKENPIFQKYVTTLTFGSSLKYAFYTLWDEKSGKMITFSQWKKSYNNVA
ncbi:MAG: fatty acid desaturase [Flavobacteriales bacterium]|nr:fatty acid desaturase [Flavobacteriales bacterium]